MRRSVRRRRDPLGRQAPQSALSAPRDAQYPGRPRKADGQRQLTEAVGEVEVRGWEDDVVLDACDAASPAGASRLERESTER
jgi:hypothetical protein